MTIDPIVDVTDAELDRWIERAWWDAVRSIAEARRVNDSILARAADSDMAYWRHLVAERDRRRAKTC